jgi:hypothetical protein
MRILSLVGLMALSSCATKPAITFWTEKNGVASVHHVTGSVDRIEKLTAKPADVENIPDGQKGFLVSTSNLDVLPKAKAKADPSPKKESKKNSGGSKLADQIHELRIQVKSLKEQVSAVSQPTPAVPVEQPAQQEAAAQPPRMSQ